VPTSCIICLFELYTENIADDSSKNAHEKFMEIVIQPFSGQQVNQARIKQAGG
jgi:hypothetical protein